ncbi:MAG: glutathione S-transferase [Inquilinus sp.]|nr:glutathione S-transferase [Inquilinus sp.]
MKLRFSPTSPYVRKVRALAIETGLADRLELAATDPWQADTDLPASNPLGKVPALELDDGTVLFDSPVICEYLDSLHGGTKLFPAAGPARWKALRLQAIGDGICDAAILRRLDGMRPAGLQSADWQQRQRQAVARACDLLEAEAGTLGGPATIGQLAIACALGYLDFRFDADKWREGRPKLAAWFADFAKRPSIAETALPPA